jgi:hypothetical protein
MSRPARTPAGLTYRVTAANAGPNATWGSVGISANIPASSASVAAPAGWGCFPTSGVTTFDWYCLKEPSTFDPGTSHEFVVQVQRPYTKPHYRLRAEIHNQGTDDLDPSNNIVNRKVGIP